MTDKALILQLIQQDLKHHQFTGGLRNLGLDDGGVHSLNILPIVARLMGIPKRKVNDRWSAVYLSFMSEAHRSNISDLVEELQAVAEKCYEMLVACTEIENRVNS